MSDIIDLKERLRSSNKHEDFEKSFRYGSDVDRTIADFMPDFDKLNRAYVDLTLIDDPEKGVLFDSEVAKEFVIKLRALFESFIETCEEEIASGGFFPP